MKSLRNYETHCVPNSFTVSQFYKAIVITGTSVYMIGGILRQSTIGKDLPIAYTSRLLSKIEESYSTIEKELLAIVYSIQFFRTYIYGRKFTLITDH